MEGIQNELVEVTQTLDNTNQDTKDSMPNIIVDSNINEISDLNEKKIQEEILIGKNDDYIKIQESELLPDIGEIDKNFEIVEQFYDLKNMSGEDKKIIELLINKDIYEIDTGTIGPITSLEYMIQNLKGFTDTSVEFLNLQVNSLSPFIFKYRKILGDGNCFYRAVMYSYLESIILEKNIYLMKSLISELFLKFSPDNENIKCLPEAIRTKLSFFRENPNIFRVLYYIYNLMNKSENLENIKEAYEIMLKSFKHFKDFDISIVMFMRFKLYEFIKSNQNKLYHKNFSVKIGNLLPSQYETNEGDFLFERFYYEDLLFFGKDAEKITIYLTPFVLKINLRIIIYEFGDSTYIENKEVECFITDKFTVSLLYRKTHYDVVYDNKTYSNYENYLSNYINQKENPKIIETFESNIEKINSLDIESLGLVDENDKVLDQKCVKCQENNISESEIYSLCFDCINSEVESAILSKYIFLLKKSETLYLNEKEASIPLLFEEVFLKICIEILGKKILIKDIESLTKISITEYIERIKKDYCCFCMEAISKSNSFQYQNQITFDLPCGCYLCSTKCSAGYFKLILTKLNKSNLICLCGYIFSYSDIKTIYEFFEFNKFSLSENLLKLLQYKFITTCYDCVEITNTNHENETSNNSKNDDEKLCNLTLENKSKSLVFNHMYCSKCYKKNKIKDGDKILCKICNLEHVIKKLKRKSKIEFYEEKKDSCNVI